MPRHASRAVQWFDAAAAAAYGESCGEIILPRERLLHVSRRTHDSRRIIATWSRELRLASSRDDSSRSSSTVMCRSFAVLLRLPETEPLVLLYSGALLHRSFSTEPDPSLSAEPSPAPTAACAAESAMDRRRTMTASSFQWDWASLMRKCSPHPAVNREMSEIIAATAVLKRDLAAVLTGGTDTPGPRSWSSHSRLHGMTRLWLCPAILHAEVCGPPQPKGHPAEHVAKEAHAEHARLDDGKAEVAGDAVEIADLVAHRRGDGEDDPADEDDDFPGARCGVSGAWGGWRRRGRRGRSRHRSAATTRRYMCFVIDVEWTGSNREATHQGEA